jgi:hypothetical protein
MSEVNHLTSWGNFILDAIGADGPIYLDTYIIAHNAQYDSDANMDDVIKIGSDNRPISIQDMKDCLSVIGGSEVFNEHLESGRSYCFEGVGKIDNHHYELWWGS